MTVDKTKVIKLIQDIEKKYGKGAIYALGSKYENSAIPRVTSNISDLDSAIGGGIPTGRLIEIYGPYSSGKTSLAYHLIAQFPIGVFIDAEGTFDGDRARLFGCKPGRVFIRRPQWGEQAFEDIFRCVDAGIPIIVVDSIPALIPRKDFEESNMEKAPEIGMVARLMSRKLPVLATKCEKTGSTVILINQVRDRINAMMFQDPYQTPGGNALKHMCSLRIKIQRKGWLTDPKLGKFGQISKIQVVKSKVCPPFREAEIPLIFNRGFVDHNQMRQIIKELREDANNDPV